MLLPPCFRCRHFKEGKPNEDYKCSAFPDGIPQEVIVWDKPHTKKTDEQVGSYTFDEVLPESRDDD